MRLRRRGKHPLNHRVAPQGTIEDESHPVVEHQREQWRVIVATGTVKWFNSQKGYGFIQPQGGGGKDVFVHISAVEKAGLSGLNEGQTVEYEVVANRGKESAENIKVK